jgi:hypothetical protein
MFPPLLAREAWRVEAFPRDTRTNRLPAQSILILAQKDEEWSPYFAKGVA